MDLSAWKPPVEPPSLATVVAESTTAATNLYNTLVEHAADLGEEARKNLNEAAGVIDEKLGKVREHVAGLVDKLTAAAAPAPPVNAVAVFEEIAKGFAHAEGILKKEGGMMIASGKVEVLITVQVPGTSTGATTRVEFQITPKPIL